MHIWKIKPLRKENKDISPSLNTSRGRKEVAEIRVHMHPPTPGRRVGRICLRLTSCIIQQQPTPVCKCDIASTLLSKSHKSNTQYKNEYTALVFAESYVTRHFYFLSISSTDVSAKERERVSA